MTKSEFIKLVEAPESVNKTDIVGLQAILKDFSYCQSAQLLLTKAFHNSENLNFESQLKKAAAFAANRKKLHDLLFSSNLQPADKIEKEAQEEIIPAAELAAPEPVEELSRIEEIKEIEGAGDKDEFLERQILSSAINSSILNEVSEEIPKDLSSLGKKVESVDFPDSSMETDQASPSFDEAEGHSFSEWLSFYGDEKEEHNEVSSKDSMGLDANAFESHTIDISNTNVPVKKEFYSAAKMAKLSVQEDDDLVTETLASIYADQGNFEKAIKAFEKLQLKYPEKRVYFAGRIKEIQNQINS